MTDWTFRTKRFEVTYARHARLSIATINTIPPQEWPISAAVDLYNRQTRQALVRKACDRATNHVLQMVVQRLRILLGPQKNRDMAQCDPCGKMVPRDDLSTVTAYGIETSACSECRGDDDA